MATARKELVNELISKILGCKQNKSDVSGQLAN
jgi:hypothetical protein